MTRLRWGSATDTGLVRRNNQDHLFVSDNLFAVADGMGGHVAGEVASEVAVNALRDAFWSFAEPRSARELLEAVRQANDAVYERSQADPDLRGMGTTITAAALVAEDDEERLAIANVGDSRTYVFSHNELTQLTEDHSVAEELVRQGQLDPEDVETHPQRHILTRAMGIVPEIDVDVWEVIPYRGDRVLLCSDGLVREMTDDQITSVLRRLADPVEAAQELVARARAQGGSDNITVVVVDVVDDDELAEKASAAVAADGVEADGAPRGEGAAGDAGPATAERQSDVDLAILALPRKRRLTLRSALFILLVLAILGGAATAVVAYARGSYYVTLGPAGTATPSPLTTATSRPVLIYQGRPGGLLWFHPTLAARTQYLSDEFCAVDVSALASGHDVSSVSAADRYLANLFTAAQQTCLSEPPPSTTTSTVRSGATTATTRQTTTPSTTHP